MDELPSQTAADIAWDFKRRQFPHHKELRQKSKERYWRRKAEEKTATPKVVPI